MIEAIVTIFRDLDRRETAKFDYVLEYQVRGHQVQVNAKKDAFPDIWIKEAGSDVLLPRDVADLCDFYDDPESGERRRGHARKYLPSHVFAYYSGKSDRLEALFQDHLLGYVQHLDESGKKVDSDAMPLVSSKDDSLTKPPEYSDLLLRRLFYFKHPHCRLVVLACLIAPEQRFKSVLTDLKVEDVDSVLFTLRKPFRLSSEIPEPDIKAGDKRFWFDRTRFSQEFLDKLWELSMAPIDYTEERVIDFRGRTEPQELLYLFLKDRESLVSLKEHIGDTYRFFRYVEGSYIADLLDDVQIFVKHKHADDLITFDQLSEGELQYLTVLGLMRITHQDECLFLLDEPDTHLNPIWKLRYFDEIEKVLKQDDDEIIKGDSQIIITTHDPMMIGSLRKEQVRIISQQNGKSNVECPDDHPQGMGVAGLLKSQYFGLRSTVDSETRRRLDRRNLLFSKGHKRSVAENEELSRLSDELADLGFASDFRDPYLELFVKRMAVHTRFHKDVLTPTEQKDQDAIADRIIEEILAEDAAE